MRVRSIATLSLMVLAMVRPHHLGAQLALEGFLGGAVSAPSPVTITQQGQPDIHFTGHWANRPTTPTWYYAIRLGYWSGNRGWQLDFTHHKIYLTNPPTDVEQFQITNGVNMLTVSRAYRTGHLRYSFGAGPVFGFPISTVRGKKYSHDNGILGGYHLAGGALLGALTREIPIAGPVYASVDVRGSASYLSVPVVDGRARLPLLAAHVHAGLALRY